MKIALVVGALLLAACTPATPTQHPATATMTPEPPATLISSPKAAEALVRFTPTAQVLLRPIPIVRGDVRTAESRGIGTAAARIEVGPEWATFSPDFQLTLLIHEYLHHAVALLPVDNRRFCQSLIDTPPTGYMAVLRAYVANNYLPLYRCPSGSEEFAYMGEQLAAGAKERRAELSEQTLSFYTNILKEVTP